MGYPGASTVASQPLDRILPPWLANARNPAMSPQWKGEKIKGWDGLSLTAKLVNHLTTKLVNRLTTNLMNRLTTNLMNCLTAKLMNRLTAKLVVVNLV